MVKKILFCLLVSSLCMAPVRAGDYPLALDYSDGGGDRPSPHLGYGSEKALSSTIGISMMGWGICLAVAIALLTSLVHQSMAAHPYDHATERS